MAGSSSNKASGAALSASSGVASSSSNVLEMGGSRKTASSNDDASSGSANGLTPQASSSAFERAVPLRSRRSDQSPSSDTGRSDSSASSSGADDGSQGSSLFDSETNRSDDTGSSRWTEASGQEASHDAGNKAMERGILEDGMARARAEEKLGRPTIHVENVSQAIDEGLGITEDKAEDAGDASDHNSDIAQGFEESSPHVVLHATATSITDTHVVVTPATNDDAAAASRKLWSIDSLSIPYTHLVYALGSHLPDPLRTSARSKPQGVSWMQHTQEQIRDSQRVVLVGGGALGVEFATDIKSVYPDKDVTLIHSRQRLLPNFDERIHEHARARLEELGVKLVLGERLALTEGCPKGSTTAALDPEEDAEEIGSASRPRPIRKPSDALHSGLKRVRTTGGKELVCDLLMLCTGQQPNSSLLASLSPTSVDPHTRLVRVLPTLQVALPPPEEAMPGPFDARPPCGDCDCFLDKKAAGASLDDRQQGHLEDHQHGSDSRSEDRQGRIPNVYAIGDVADAFGSLNAGYQAWGMADIAAENIVRDIGEASREPTSTCETPSTVPEPAEMVHFNPAPNMLKLSLGLGKMVFQGALAPHDAKGNRIEAPAPEQTSEAGGSNAEGDVVMRPEISMKQDPDDLGVEGVWTFMANASTDDLYA